MSWLYAVGDCAIERDGSVYVISFRGTVSALVHSVDRFGSRVSMQSNISNQTSALQVAPAVDRGNRSLGCAKVLLIFAGLLALAFGGGLIFIMYVGLMGPATYVYPSGQVPQRFLNVAEEIGGLQAGESVEFFYSDGFTDVKDGFSYVSDRKVVVFMPDGEPPLLAIPYGDIQSVEIERDGSFLYDSIITLETEDSYISIPFSSEMDRDIDVYEAIRARVQEVD